MRVFWNFCQRESGAGESPDGARVVEIRTPPSVRRGARPRTTPRPPTLRPVATALPLALLVLAFVLGYAIAPLRKAVLVVVVAWAVLMPALFVGVGVADDGDWGAFVFAAMVVIALAVGLTWLGSRVGRSGSLSRSPSRRSRERSRSRSRRRFG